MFKQVNMCTYKLYVNIFRVKIITQKIKLRIKKFKQSYIFQMFVLGICFILFLCDKKKCP